MMSSGNNDLNTLRRNPGTQDGNAPSDGNLASDGYETIDRADSGRSRDGLTTDIKRSYEGSKYYQRSR
ncbi:MAG: hypothetical protein GY938_05010 [Ketobacter sp.]|nr:hypothetical protein [Ketobacter sp.]